MLYRRRRSGLFFPAPAIIHSAAGGGGGGGGGGTSQAYLNFSARYGSAPDTTHDDAYGTLLDTLTTAGIFSAVDGSSSLLEFLYLISTDASANAVLNLVSSSYTLTLIGSPSFTANQGYTLNGSSQYLKTGFVPNAANLWSLNNAAMGVWDHTNRTTSNTSIQIGAVGATGASTSQILTCYTGAGNKNHMLVNSVQATGNNTGTTTAQGLTAVSRSSNSIMIGYKYFGSGTPETRSQGFSDTETPVELYIGARNNNGTPDSLTTDLIGAAFGGASLDGTQMNSIAAAINQFMIDVGAPYHW